MNRNRHAAAAQELEARNDWNSKAGTFDISLTQYADGNRLKLWPSAFPLMSRSVPLLQKHWMKLFETRAMNDVMRSPSDRAMLRRAPMKTR